jgi:lipopolysaccharide transport system ATP-binding protein
MGEVSKGEGRTVLFVSHNMAAVQSLCGKGIVLKDGSLSFSGSVVEAVTTYQKTEVSNEIINSSWDEENAPGDYRAKILTASAKPTKGDVINFGSGVTLTFLVKSMIENSLLDVSFELKNNEGVLIFHHGNFISNSSSLIQGIYKMEVQIPPNMLNEGDYHIDVWLGLASSEVLGSIKEYAICFNVAASEIDHILKQLPGILRPVLEYDTTLINGK